MFCRRYYPNWIAPNVNRKNDRLSYRWLYYRWYQDSRKKQKKKRCLNSLRPSTPFSCFHTRFTQIQQRREKREKETGRRKHFERSPENRKRVTWTKEEKKTNRRLFSFLAFFFLFLSRFDVAAVVAVESYIMVASLHNIILYIQHTDTHFGRGK